MLETTDVRVRLGGKDVLAGVTLRVQPGEIVGLVAPNGSGKSTLLTTLAGRWGGLAGDRPGDLAGDQAGCRLGSPAERSGGSRPDSQPGGQPDSRLSSPASGLLQADGISPRDARQYHQQVVLVESGRAPLVSSMQVCDQMALVARRWGQPAGAVDRIVRLCEMADYLGKTPRQLSDGMARQAALALGYLTGARYLLLDEPFTSLDPTRVLLNERIMRRLADAGCGLLVSSHVLSEVDRLCDRVVFLKDGRAVEPRGIGAPTSGPVARAVASHVGAPREASSAQDIYQELFGENGR